MISPHRPSRSDFANARRVSFMVATLIALADEIIGDDASARPIKMMPVETWWSLARRLNHKTGEFTAPIRNCGNLPLTQEQLTLCEADREHGYAKMRVAARSSLATVRECGRQFQERRWNCHSFAKANDRGPLFGAYIQLNGTREAAFVHALMSASVAHEAADACSKGQLHDCLCAVLSPAEEAELVKKIPPSLTVNSTRENSRTRFSWGGCHSNIEYGLKFAEKLIHTTTAGLVWSEARQLMNKHNMAAGQKLMKTKMKVKCKCHGLSGSCAAKVCWRALPSFQKVGNLLQERYNNATRMKLDQAKKKLTRFNKLLLSPSDEDLVYTDQSPSYCSANAVLGILGTNGRECRLESDSSDSCDVLCCDRGYKRQQVIMKSKCHCRFIWCCEVRCEVCTTTMNKYFCN